MRYRQWNDDLPKDFELAGAQRLRDSDVQRSDLRYAFVHHNHAREERGVEQDNEFGHLIDAEIDDHQRNQRDRWQRAKEIDHRIGKGARRTVPAEQEAHRYSGENPQSDAEKNPPRRSI